MVCGPDGGVGVQRVEPWKVELLLAGTGPAVEDGVFQGFGGGPAPWTEGGEVAVEPGGVGGQVALTGPHLMYAASYELREAHEGVRCQGGAVGVTRGRRCQGGPLA